MSATTAALSGFEMRAEATCCPNTTQLPGVIACLLMAACETVADCCRCIGVEDCLSVDMRVCCDVRLLTVVGGVDVALLCFV